jgi:hypothetical protein
LIEGEEEELEVAKPNQEEDCKAADMDGVEVQGEDYEEVKRWAEEREAASCLAGFVQLHSKNNREMQACLAKNRTMKSSGLLVLKLVKVMM